MGQVRSLDEAINERGYLRLTTCEPLVKHMGNRLPAGSSPLQETSTAQHQSTSRRFWDFPWVKQSLLKAYDQIFKLYFG